MADSAGPASRVSTGNETEVLLARAERRHGKDAPVTEQLREQLAGSEQSSVRPKERGFLSESVANARA